MRGHEHTEDTSTQAHKHTSTQAHKHTSTQAHKHTSTQVVIELEPKPTHIQLENTAEHVNPVPTERFATMNISD
jgi:hypothetical protein